jgi:hypothetical protein
LERWASSLPSTTGLGVSENILGICCTKGIVCHYSHSSSARSPEPAPIW